MSLSSISLKHKFIGLSSIIMLAIGGMAVEAVHTTDTLSNDAAKLNFAAEVTQRHMTGDMMHDAIRGDVTVALGAARDNDAAGVVQAGKDLQDHAGVFFENLDANKKADVPPAIKKELEGIYADVQAYRDEATALIDATAKGGYEAGHAKFPKFLEAFEKLEKSQSDATDHMAKWAEQIKLASQKNADEAHQIILLVGAVVFFLTLGLPLMVVRSILNPMDQMLGVMAGLVGGNLNVNVPHRARRDEMGKMAGAVQHFKEKLQEIDKLAAERETLRQQNERDKKEAMSMLADDFERKLKNIVDTVSAASADMETSSKQVNGTVQVSTQKTGLLQSQIEETSRNVATVAAAAEELSSSIMEISKQVSRSAGIAGEAVTASQQADATVQNLAQASNKIGEVADLITEITGQINLLALNATIESARAGEAGKGFAVVASEVKNLASQTAKATEEIRQSISSIQSTTQDTVDKIKSITNVIHEISHISTSIAGAVEEQQAATQEIARNITQASASTIEITGYARDVLSAVASAESAASLLRESSGRLTQQSDILDKTVHDFADTLRAG